MAADASARPRPRLCRSARLAANGICWEQLGEIVAYNSCGIGARRTVRRAVVHLDGHAPIMLGGDYTHAGGSWTTGEQRAQLRGDDLRQAVRRDAAPSRRRRLHRHRAARRSAATSSGSCSRGSPRAAARDEILPRRSLVRASRWRASSRRATGPPGRRRSTTSPTTSERAPRPTSTASPRPASPPAARRRATARGRWSRRGQMATLPGAGAATCPPTGTDYFCDDDEQHPRGRHQPPRGRRHHAAAAEPVASARRSASPASRWPASCAAPSTERGAAVRLP